MHPTYLSAIERGLRNPTWAKLSDLAEAFGITLAALVQVAEAEAYGAMYVPGSNPATRRTAA
jgi:transcriptional regulator with XRE-family HTH domain